SVTMTSIRTSSVETGTRRSGTRDRGRSWAAPEQTTANDRVAAATTRRPRLGPAALVDGSFALIYRSHGIVARASGAGPRTAGDSGPDSSRNGVRRSARGTDPAPSIESTIVDRVGLRRRRGGRH